MNVKKLVAIACSAFAVLGADAAVTSRSYVQRGLTAQYDGINNVGHDVSHDPGATVWKDLTGNGNDGTCASVLSWGEDGWSVSTNCKPISVPAPGLAATMGSGSFTIQFVCTPSIDGKRQAFFSQYNSNGGFGLEHNTGGSFVGKLRYYRAKADSSDSEFNYLTANPGAVISANAFTSASVAISPTEQKCWLNGTLSDSRTGSLTGVSSFCPSVIGGEVQEGSKRTGDAYTTGYGITFQGEYNAFRLYGRTLSEDEAKVNSAVDAIRFNGANPAEFTLGGGWSFDGDGDLCVEVTATAFGEGTVSGSATVKQYTTVALTAAPASGNVFYRWEGDTDIISSGSVYDAAITVTATDPGALVAVFKTPRASSCLYVQDGLVAAYDGIDNVGTGSHDSSATTWKNLTGDTALDGTCDSKLSWKNGKGWSVSGDCKPVTVGTGIAQTMATTNFTINVACVPSMIDKRMAYFSQYNGSTSYGSASFEHQKTTGKLRLFRTKESASASGNFDWISTATVAADSFVSFAYTVAPDKCAVYKDGVSAQTYTSAGFGPSLATTESVIGGEVQRSGRTSDSDYTSGYGITFQGEYNAFRIYNRVLEADEIAWNAKLDAVRFDGADAATTLGAGYSYDTATDKLTATVSATATAGGKVSYCNGAASSSAGRSFVCDGTTVASFAAIPDAGYLFDRWTGDTDLIASGSFLTPEITVKPDRAATLVAKFRRNGDAADGLKYDISFTGDAAADGITFSSTDSETKQRYETADVQLPVLPTVTNSAVSCIYVPQPITETNTVFRQDARISGIAVTGEVATVFCRFRWDGSVLPGLVNYPAIIMNGYTSWNKYPNEGFCLRMRVDANATCGYFSFIFPNNSIAYNNAGITTTGPACVNQGRWVDVFASVYPSPTDPTLSNADVWYCEVPSWNSGGYFDRSEVGHRHFGDRCAIPRMNTKTQKTVIFGSEPAAEKYPIASGNGVKCFRGAIACAKGWNRLLSENEMWTVMADLGGVQSFTDLTTLSGRTYTTDNLYTGDYFKEGRNGTQTSFLGGDPAAHRWRSLTTTYPYNTLLWNAPKDASSMPVVLSTKIGSVKDGNTHPIHLEVNGTKVWPTDAASREVVQGDEIRVEIGAEYTYPGLNELKWVYDTSTGSNWMIFDRHKLRLRTNDGLVIFLR